MSNNLVFYELTYRSTTNTFIISNRDDLQEYLEFDAPEFKMRDTPKDFSPRKWVHINFWDEPSRIALNILTDLGFDYIGYDYNLIVVRLRWDNYDQKLTHSPSV